jgi:hypothetical protein
VLSGDVQSQPVGQCVNGATLGGGADTSFEIADRAYADTGTRRQRFERQVLPDPKRPK